MLSQWDCLLKNLGRWKGSFTRLSPKGQEIEDTPTLVTLEGINNNQTIRQIVRRFHPNQEPEDLVLEYSSLNNTILLFEDGAFSQGSIQWGPYAEFGAELGLIEGQRRLRMVQLYDKEGQFERLSLIRERAEGTNAPYKPPLTVDQLLGEWQGEAVSLSRQLYPNRYRTNLKVEQHGNKIKQHLTFDSDSQSPKTIASTARIDGSRLLFEDGDVPVQVLMLDDGASSVCPLRIKSGHRFILEMGWLIDPTLRKRLIRSYDVSGSWVGCTLVTETKIA